jgi:hypothetical protein
LLSTSPGTVPRGCGQLLLSTAMISVDVLHAVAFAPPRCSA